MGFLLTCDINLYISIPTIHTVILLNAKVSSGDIVYTVTIDKDKDKIKDKDKKIYFKSHTY